MIRLEASQGGGRSSSERQGVRGLNANAEHVTIDETVCAVCQYDDSYDDNLIIVCDGCDVAVHQVCYGVKKVPSGPWLCDPCSQGQKRNPKPPAPVCCLCHKKGGAFKTTDDSRWAHIMCAIWIPQTCVQNNETMCPIVGIDRVPQETWQMRCDFCQCQGACIRCSEPGCAHVFHPVCARSNGCVMDIGEGERGEIEYRATCPQHSEFASSSASSITFERRSKEVVLEPQTIRDLVPIQKVCTSLAKFSFCGSSVQHNFVGRFLLRFSSSLTSSVACMTIGSKNAPDVVVLFWQDFTYAATALNLLYSRDVTCLLLCCRLFRRDTSTVIATRKRARPTLFR
jgi:hypothetical protein